jgi:hypothetical protein
MQREWLAGGEEKDEIRSDEEGRRRRVFVLFSFSKSILTNAVRGTVLVELLSPPGRL